MRKINFEETYPAKYVSGDLSYMLFDSADQHGKPVEIKIHISPHPDPLLPKVFNLGFGPPLSDGTIDDTTRINHQDLDKVLSTVLFYGYFFLVEQPNLTLGIDGSNDARAYLYHRMIILNNTYLSQFFIPIGVDWYVRLLRNGQVETDGGELPFFKPRPEPFDFQRPAIDLYRYYMFHLKR